MDKEKDTEDSDKMCLRRLLGYCKDCVHDLDTSKHPNNYDCPGFKVVVVKGIDISGD